MEMANGDRENGIGEVGDGKTHPIRDLKRVI